MVDSLPAIVRVMLHQEEKIYLTIQIGHLEETLVSGMLMLRRQGIRLVQRQKLVLSLCSPLEDEQVVMGT